MKEIRLTGGGLKGVGWRGLKTERHGGNPSGAARGGSTELQLHFSV